MHLAKQSPDFDPRNYGFLSHFNLVEASGIAQGRVHRVKNPKIIMVRLKGERPVSPGEIGADGAIVFSITDLYKRLPHVIDGDSLGQVDLIETRIGVFVHRTVIVPVAVSLLGLRRIAVRLTGSMEKGREWLFATA